MPDHISSSLLYTQGVWLLAVIFISLSGYSIDMIRLWSTENIFRRRTFLNLFYHLFFYDRFTFSCAVMFGIEIIIQRVIYVFWYNEAQPIFMIIIKHAILNRWVKKLNHSLPTINNYQISDNESNDLSIFLETKSTSFKCSNFNAF